MSMNIWQEISLAATVAGHLGELAAEVQTGQAVKSPAFRTYLGHQHVEVELDAVPSTGTGHSLSPFAVGFTLVSQIAAGSAALSAGQPFQSTPITLAVFGKHLDLSLKVTPIA